jgi:D-glycero-D-manno-heptose 1,7-bisphosphate phosphatase
VNNRPAIFLDRDGVINVDHGYVHRIGDFEFLPGVFEFARFVKLELQWPIIVVTNQAGIGRGFFAEKDYQTLTEWMCRSFAERGAPIDKVYHCPFHPTHGIGSYKLDHPWRKPRPGMLIQAAKDIGVDLNRSVLVGDKLTDIEAAAAAGVQGRMLLNIGGQEVGITDIEYQTVCSFADLEKAIKAYIAGRQ